MSIETAQRYISNDYILKEFDPDHLGKKDMEGKSAITKSYSAFYRKHHYIPRYFNAKSRTEVTDYAPTLATSCGQKGSIGSILYFYVDEEIEMVINDETMDLNEAHKVITKLLRIAEPKERKRTEEMLRWYYYTQCSR